MFHFSGGFMVSRINNKNRYDLVYEEIKTNIINNNLKPGEKLNVQTLSEQLGVSRTPVSNAMQALERDGYVVILPQNGTYVRELTKEETNVLYRLREEIEKLVLELIVNQIDRSGLERYKNRFLSMKENKKESELVVKEFFELELEFHDYIISQGPSIIKRETQNIIDLTKRSRKLCMKYEIEQEADVQSFMHDVDIHVNIIDAMLEGNVEKAKVYVEEDARETKTMWFRIQDKETKLHGEAVK